MTIYLLRHGDSFIIPFITFFSTIGMRKQFLRDHNTDSIQGVNRYNNARLLFYSYKLLHGMLHVSSMLSEGILCYGLEAF